MFAGRLHRRRFALRGAAAAAELAICLPLLVMLMLGSIETCSMIYLRHSLTIAGYEGARVAIDYDGTSSAARARSQQILNARSVDNATVSVSPGNVSNVPRGQPISITVSAPCDVNCIIPPWYYRGKILSTTMTMIKE
jgi:Flp pilus assembly protein TadG